MTKNVACVLSFLTILTLAISCQHQFNTTTGKQKIKVVEVNGVFKKTYRYCQTPEVYWFDKALLISERNGDYDIAYTDAKGPAKTCKNNRLNRIVARQLKGRTNKNIRYHDLYSDLGNRVKDPAFTLDESRHYGGDLYRNKKMDSTIIIAFNIEGKAILQEEYCNKFSEKVGFVGCPCPRVRITKPFLSLLYVDSIYSLTTQQVTDLNIVRAEIESFRIMECD